MRCIYKLWLAGGQSQSSQGHFCNTDMNNETGSFTNLDFNKGLFDTGNHATCQFGSGTNTQSLPNKKEL